MPSPKNLPILQESSLEESTPTAEQKKRYFYELLVAGILIVIVLTGTWLQLTLSAIDSWIFITLFNINSLFMLVVLFLVSRNIVKLVMERRRNVFGSKIRTRLVLIFVSLTLIPTVLMFLAANRVVITSVDYWFTKQIEDSFEAALDVGKSFYEASAKRQQARVAVLMNEIRERDMRWTGKAMNTLFEIKQKEYGFTLIGTVSPTFHEQNWHIDPDFEKIWGKVKNTIDWKHIAENSSGSFLWATETADYIIAIQAIDSGKAGYLITAENIGQGLLVKIDGISKGFKEYIQLKELKKPLRISFMLILGILGMSIIFGGIWFGFRLSKEITAPILALANGTKRIAQGELDVRIADHGHDELGLLVDGFNRMAEDLREGQTRLTYANSQLEQQHATVAKRNAYIETILDTITTGVVTLDIHGNFVTMNKAVRDMFRVSYKGLLGSHPRNFLSLEHGALFDAMLQTMRLDPDKPWTDTIDFTLGKRSWKLVVYAVALFHEDSLQGFVIVLDDITELEKMQRMAAWREVAQRIAHEIKNPLTPIKLSAQRLERKYNAIDQDPIFTQCTEVIIKQVERLQFMVQEFSAFANVPEIHLESGSLHGLLEELCALFTTSHPKVTWHIDIEQALPAIKLDPSALHRALFNIISNSLEAMAGMPEQSMYVEAKHAKEGNLVSVSIRDTGPGLTIEERERLFEPYFTNKQGGTGLGMTIVKTIINDHHAIIRAYTVPTGGTEIVLEFPTC